MKMKIPVISHFSSCVCLWLVIWFVNSASAIQITNEYWISTNIISGGGLGTLDSPFDGSTANNFDSIMTNMLENCTIHLLAGTYQTMGYTNPAGGNFGWYVKHGQHIQGSGIDVTTIHLQRTNQVSLAIGSTLETNVQGCELSDFTLDMSGTTNVHGIGLYGAENIVRRVRVVNITSTGGELFPMEVGQGIVEGCEITNFNGGSCSAISFTLGGYGQLRNNRVYLQNAATAPIPGNQFAFNVINARNVLIDGNYVNYSAVGVYSDGGPNTNITIVNNQFINCDSALALLNHAHQNVSFCFNNVSNPQEASNGTVVVVQFLSNPLTNVLIAGNIFSFGGLPGVNSALINSTATTGLTIVNNSIDSRYIKNIAGCTQVNMYNNTDLFGAPSVVFNQIIPPNSITRKSISSSYTATYADDYLGLKASATVTLPSAVGHVGKEIIIADESGSSLASGSLQTSSGTINGGSSVGYLFAPYSRITAISDGTNWFARRK